MSDVTEGTQPTTPNNRTGCLFLEAVLRDFLSYQLHEVYKQVDNPEVTFLEELFHKAGSATVKNVKDWWRKQSDIPVVINYPRSDVASPFVAVVNGGERTKDEESYLSDFGGVAYYGKQQVTLEGAEVLVGNIVQRDVRPRGQYVRQLLSVPMSHSTKIFVSGQDPNTATYLYYVVLALLLVNKVSFIKYGGTRDLSFSGGDIEHHPELFPDWAYFKVITLTYDSNFDIPLRKESVIGGVDVSLSTYLGGVVTEDVNLGE